MKKAIKIIGGAVILAGVGVGVFFGARAIYDSGIRDGRALESNEVSENVKNLGAAVSEKETFKSNLISTLSEIPAELNSEGIDSYIEKLNNLINETETESVKNTLNEYLNNWKSFKDVYAGENNNEISEKFNELKISANDTAAKIKSLYDTAIQEAIEKL